MSDPHDRSVFGGAQPAPPLSGHPVQHSATRSFTGPPRGAVVVAEGPATKKTSKPAATQKVEGREISIVGSFDNPWRREPDEVDAMAHNRWEPTSDDFLAVAGKSGLKVSSWKGLLQVILTNGDAESKAGSISRLNIFTHANSNLIALSGTVTPRDAMADVSLGISSGITEETLDQLNSGITVSVVSKDRKLASKNFTLTDIQSRFTKDAVIVIYACHGAVDGAFVQYIANTFQVKVRAFHDVIGYFPAFDEADSGTNRPAKVTNRVSMGVGYNSKVKVNDFHKLDTNAVDRDPKPVSKAGSKDDDDD